MYVLLPQAMEMKACCNQAWWSLWHEKTGLGKQYQLQTSGEYKTICHSTAHICNQYPSLELRFNLTLSLPWVTKTEFSPYNINQISDEN